MTRRILFVCLGNICRSPSAEAVMRAKAKAAGVAVDLDSAGTGNWHVGKPPYAPMYAVAHGRGYAMSGLRARQVQPADFAAFDRIIAMDSENVADLEALRPGPGGAPVQLFTDFVAGPADHVPDPYFTRDFDGALDLIEVAADGLLAELQRG